MAKLLRWAVTYARPRDPTQLTVYVDAPTERAARAECVARFPHPIRIASVTRLSPALERRVALAAAAAGVASASTSFSDFIRNGTPERKAEVYGRVMDKVAEQQQAVIDGVRVDDGETKGK